MPTTASIEDTVKMVVLAPLLFLADLYLNPFYIEAEKSVELVTVDENILVRGSIDVLLLIESFWVVAIEAKRSQYSVEAGLPQLLFYMLNDPSPEQVTFGLLTNGSSFRFIKVTKRRYRSMPCLNFSILGVKETNFTKFLHFEARRWYNFE